MRKKCVIISGGEYDPAVEVLKDDYVIACDKGYSYALKMNVKPNLVIADFDSYEGGVGENIPVLKFPSEKDDTDTMAAVKWAVGRGFKEIFICCALGGRLDHMMANIQSGAYIAGRGLKAKICSSTDEMHFIKDGELVLKKKEGFSLSVFSLTDISEGVTIKGAKYEMEDGELTNSFPLGVSNEWKDEEVKISVKKGMLLTVTSKY
jgi:thiamine pyrophosphokinase